MTEWTMLNSMASKDFTTSLDTQKEWGIHVLDLKDHIYGKAVTDLTSEEARQAAEEIRSRGLSAYCLSTELFHDDIEKGEAHFRSHHLGKIEQTIQIARALQPRVVRLLSARSGKRSEFADSVAYLAQHHPWLIPMYREAIDRLHAAGFQTTIENECHECIFSKPEEILSFFRELDRSDKVYFTYDVQNLWQMGTFPSMDVYRKLSPLIGFFHLKGGIKEENGSDLEWKSSLQDASWPVLELTRQVIRDGKSPVICLNPSHGKVKPGYNYEFIFKRDLEYIRNQFSEVL